MWCIRLSVQHPQEKRPSAHSGNGSAKRWRRAFRNLLVLDKSWPGWSRGSQRSLQTSPDFVNGILIAFIKVHRRLVNRDVEDHGCRIVKERRNPSGRRSDNGFLDRGATQGM